MPLVSIPRSIASKNFVNFKDSQGEAKASLPKAMPTLKQHNLKPCQLYSNTT